MLERTGNPRGRAILAKDCALGGAERKRVAFQATEVRRLS